MARGVWRGGDSLHTAMRVEQRPGEVWGGEVQFWGSGKDQTGSGFEWARRVGRLPWISRHGRVGREMWFGEDAADMRASLRRQRLSGEKSRAADKRSHGTLRTCTHTRAWGS